MVTLKTVSPSTNLTAFNCPHCGALAHQSWFDCYVIEAQTQDKIPACVVPEKVEEIALEIESGRAVDDDLRDYLNQLSRGNLILDGSEYYKHVFALQNLFFSKCFSCKGVSVWRHSQLIYPSYGDAPEVNPDTPNEIKRDYEEASIILNKSPRGAAALLRLAIQKLCVVLGKPGKNINSDIAALVAEGLDPRVQKALDVLRVIGNEAVHPGQIDLKDDRETAEGLFKLFNLIVDKLISEPKHIDAIYDLLPKEKLAGIEDRDKK